MWDLIVSVPDHCLSFYLPHLHQKYDKAVFLNNDRIRGPSRELSRYSKLGVQELQTVSTRAECL